MLLQDVQYTRWSHTPPAVSNTAVKYSSRSAWFEQINRCGSSTACHKDPRSGSVLDLPASEQIRQRPTFAADMMTPDVFRWVKNNKSTEQKLATGGRTLHTACLSRVKSTLTAFTETRVLASQAWKCSSMPKDKLRAKPALRPESNTSLLCSMPKEWCVRINSMRKTVRWNSVSD